MYVHTYVHAYVPYNSKLSLVFWYIGKIFESHNWYTSIVFSIIMLMWNVHYTWQVAIWFKHNAFNLSVLLLPALRVHFEKLLKTVCNFKIFVCNSFNNFLLYGLCILFYLCFHPSNKCLPCFLLSIYTYIRTYALVYNARMNSKTFICLVTCFTEPL